MRAALLQPPGLMERPEIPKATVGFTVKSERPHTTITTGRIQETMIVVANALELGGTAIGWRAARSMHTVESILCWQMALFVLPARTSTSRYGDPFPPEMGVKSRVNFSFLASSHFS